MGKRSTNGSAARATDMTTSPEGPSNTPECTLVAVPAQPVENVDSRPESPAPRSREVLMRLGSPTRSSAPALHPAADAVNEMSVQWAQAMGLVRSQAHIDALRATRLGHLFARVFPATGHLVALQIAVDWTTLFFCLDDRLEQIHGAVLTAAYLRSLLGVFRDGSDPALIDPFSHGFADLRERMLELRIPNWIPRFTACIERLFNGFIDEAKYRTIGLVPGIASHRKIRQITIGLSTGFLLGELTEHITLPPEALEHEVVQALERSASTIVGLANDLYTVEKERAKGEVNNTVLVHMHELEISYEAALDRTIQLHNIEMREFLRLTEQLPRFDAQTDRQLRRYVEVLGAFISGHEDWARHTGRYTRPGDDTAAS